ncbi:M48 family metallopeptidase, partial [Patescibacteria group bacterium]|nr:M48 family metallopeptidase [Patescibacteria group bacterium]
MVNRQKTNLNLLRVKGERTAFVTLLILIAVLTYVFIETNLYLISAAIIGGFIYIRLLQAQQLGNSIKITEHQLPDIYRLVKHCTRRLGLKKTPNVFITQDPTMNAYTMGFKTPYIIVLNSGLVEKLSPQELTFVIGHE